MLKYRKMANISSFIVFMIIIGIFIFSLINFPVNAKNISGASLVAYGSCSGDCYLISATVINGGDGDMPGPVSFEVQKREGQSWVTVGGGILGPLAAGESATITYNPNGVEGIYRFKVYQPEGHPGRGYLFVDACTVICELPTSTPEEPTATPQEPTPTPQEPTATPEKPTSTPEEPTITPEKPTLTPEEPTITPEKPTPTPEKPTATPEKPTPTPEEPTVTPEKPTPTPFKPTPTKVYPTKSP